MLSEAGMREMTRQLKIAEVHLGKVYDALETHDFQGQWFPSGLRDPSQNILNIAMVIHAHLHPHRAKEDTPQCTPND
jgi:hypothetical protein